MQANGAGKEPASMSLNFTYWLNKGISLLHGFVQVRKIA
jgi:hypothetical protein